MMGLRLAIVYALMGYAVEASSPTAEGGGQRKYTSCGRCRNINFGEDDRTAYTDNLFTFMETSSIITTNSTQNLKHHQKLKKRYFRQDKPNTLQARSHQIDLTQASAETKQKSSNVKKDITAFYHVFMPDVETPRANDIVKEQLETVLRSDMRERIKSIEITTVNKNVSIVGCDLCHHTEHFLDGYEERSLEKVYDYCVQHPMEKVIYFHSKGTFHDRPLNALLRKTMMRSILSRECLDVAQTLQPYQCNVCGLRYSPFPHSHYSGNFFSADCSYISKLTRPSQSCELFKGASTMVFGEGNAFRFKDSPQDFGLDRFASEYWVATHPDFVPCDVYNGSFTWGYRGELVDGFPMDLKGPLRWKMHEYRCLPARENMFKES
ncbi:hypothetical protein AAMO2058_000352100 [Amorphochlora amoebiformis]